MIINTQQTQPVGVNARVDVAGLPVETRSVQLERVAIAYPSGNTTAVVFDRLSDDRKILNDRILHSWRMANPTLPDVEQCCFVGVPRNSAAVARVEMFGGEFCGNAARSVIWLLSEGKDCKGLIEFSGVERLLEFEVCQGEVSVAMPLPDKAVLMTPVKEGLLVQLDGIAQLVVTDRNFVESARDLLTTLLNMNCYGLTSQPAVGVSRYDQESNRAVFCVWVKKVGTIFDESACGSGTSAIGIALALSKGESIELPVIQPSGAVITTTTTMVGDQIMESRIKGSVTVLFDGALQLL